jgi:uncharacterized peroxidase-related enzyme
MATIDPVLRENAAPELQEIYDGMIRRFGAMPNFYGKMAHVPGALKQFIPFYKAVVGPGGVEAKYKELAYLKTAAINGCEYCSRAHTGPGKKSGITDAQLAALTFYRRSPLFGDKEKAVLLFAERVTRGAAGIRERALEEISAHFTPAQVVELTLTICVANFTNRFNDTLQVEPDQG